MADQGAPHHTRASVAAGDIGELALERAGGGPSVGPFHFGRYGGHRAAIARDTSPCKAKVLWLGNPVPHVSPRIIRSGPTPRVEFALNVEKPGLVSLISLVLACDER